MVPKNEIPRYATQELQKPWYKKTKSNDMQLKNYRNRGTRKTKSKKTWYQKNEIPRYATQELQKPWYKQNEIQRYATQELQRPYSPY